MHAEVVAAAARAVVAAAAAAAVAAAGVEDAAVVLPTFPFHAIEVTSMNIHGFWSFLRRLALALMTAVPLAAAAVPQQTYPTPQAAVDALMEALKADSDPAMFAIFGDEHKSVLLQSDRAATSADRARILAAMQTHAGAEGASAGSSGARHRRGSVAGALSDRSRGRPLALCHGGGR